MPTAGELDLPFSAFDNPVDADGVPVHIPNVPVNDDVPDDPVDDDWQNYFPPEGDEEDTDNPTPDPDNPTPGPDNPTPDPDDPTPDPPEPGPQSGSIIGAINDQNKLLQKQNQILEAGAKTIASAIRNIDFSGSYGQSTGLNDGNNNINFDTDHLNVWGEAREFWQMQARQSERMADGFEVVLDLMAREYEQKERQLERTSNIVEMAYQKFVEQNASFQDWVESGFAALNEQMLNLNAGVRDISGLQPYESLNNNFANDIRMLHLGLRLQLSKMSSDGEFEPIDIPEDSFSDASWSQLYDRVALIEEANWQRGSLKMQTMQELLTRLNSGEKLDDIIADYVGENNPVQPGVMDALKEVAAYGIYGEAPEVYMKNEELGRNLREDQNARFQQARKETNKALNDIDNAILKMESSLGAINADIQTEQAKENPDEVKLEGLLAAKDKLQTDIDTYKQKRLDLGSSWENNNTSASVGGSNQDVSKNDQYVNKAEDIASEASSFAESLDTSDENTTSDVNISIPDLDFTPLENLNNLADLGDLGRMAKQLGDYYEYQNTTGPVYGGSGERVTDLYGGDQELPPREIHTRAAASLGKGEGVENSITPEDLQNLENGALPAIDVELDEGLFTQKERDGDFGQDENKLYQILQSMDVTTTQGNSSVDEAALSALAEHYRTKY